LHSILFSLSSIQYHSSCPFITCLPHICSPIFIYIYLWSICFIYSHLFTFSNPSIPSSVHLVIFVHCWHTSTCFMSVYLFTSYSRLYVLYLQVSVCSCRLTVMSHLYFFSLYVFMFHSIYSGLSSLFTCSSLLAGLFPCSCPLAYLSHFCVFQSTIYLFQFIHIPVCSYIYFSLFMCFSLSVFQSISMFWSICISVSFQVSSCFPVCLNIWVHNAIHVFFLIYLCILVCPGLFTQSSPFIFQSVHIFIPVYASPPVHLHVPVCLCVSLLHLKINRICHFYIFMF
jgi:hypothetical protein